MLVRYFLAPLAALLLLAAVPRLAQAQTGGVGLGTPGAPDASATLEIKSTSKVLLPPRLTQVQRDAVASPDVTFAYAGAVQTYTVPAGVTSLVVDMAGAAGGTGDSRDMTQGLGGWVQATLAVVPGEVLTILVGGACVAKAGGYYGGGSSFSTYGPTDTGGGGGTQMAGGLGGVSGNPNFMAGTAGSSGMDCAGGSGSNIAGVGGPPMPGAAPAP